ncbi:MULTISPECIES: hypothetical protein [Vibrio]|uniref:hypothetical protein n=1 Tax=Vibrio TaxID=662 RepID=UPI000C840E84|nr:MULTISPECIES: hypothetical protein [Vibrio]PML07660.1 hypothetical protein BCT85_20280 [Vibrio lentus]
MILDKALNGMPKEFTTEQFLNSISDRETEKVDLRKANMFLGKRAKLLAIGNQSSHMWKKS